MSSIFSIFGRSRILANQLVTLVLLIAPQWLVTRELFNGKSTAFAAMTGLKDGLFADLQSANWVVGIAFLKLVFAVGDWVHLDYLLVVKLLTSLMMLGMYAEFVLLARRLFNFPDDESRLVGLVCLASPALYTYIGTTVIPNPLCFWFMLIGHRLFWSDRVAVRLAGLAVMVVSFQVASNLVFALALDVVYLARFADQRRRRVGWFVLLFAATLAVYSAMRLLSPPAEYYATYNQLLNPFHREGMTRLVLAIAKFLTWVVIPLGALALALLVAPLRRRLAAGADRPDYFALAASVFLCASAAFPYVMVGKGPALFTWVSFGSGVTEQLLREVYAGPFAPRWGSPTLQHGILFSIPLGFLTWTVTRLAWQKLRVWSGTNASAIALYAVTIPLSAVWVFPAYQSRLETQAAEIALAKGLAQLPPPPAGVVDLRFTPRVDWMFWGYAANLAMRDAWGRSHWFGMFHQTDGVRDDLLWQYHTAFLALGGVASAPTQHLWAMDGFPGPDCITRYSAQLPRVDGLDLWLGGLQPSRVPRAVVQPLGTQCQPGRSLPNPTPDRVVIP